MTPGNLSAHLSKLEEAGYVEVTKEFIERKPHTALALTKAGRAAFKDYRRKVELFVEKYLNDKSCEIHTNNNFFRFSFILEF
jgi:DNA-binding PadR family transcriptional regulator